ncbi:MAG: enoyl-CoA hydratase/isomerase family protein [Deltaproteobacteria bacterium]|nr:enoyl-CoA hydratase/isomerase family protein [Deltaproteobacteria bacterium]
MFNTEIDAGHVATIFMDNGDKPVNIINEGFFKNFEASLDDVFKDEQLKGIILTATKKDFLAGADLDLLLKSYTPESFFDLSRRLHKLTQRYEQCGKPVVAAINGSCLGGGYEIALGCHYRVALDNDKIKIGLPEVTLGLLPGGGGTQRLLRLIGIIEAMPFLLEGKTVRPQDALKSGLVNELAETPEALIAKAKAWINTTGKNVQPWYDKQFKIPGGNPLSPKVAQWLTGATAQVTKRTQNNYPAPKAILSCLFEGGLVDFETSLKIEARYFASLAKDQVAKSMIRTFFFNLNSANSGKARPRDIPKHEVKKVGILGAGMMGAGIAYVTAKAGIDVVLKDVTLEAAEKGKSYSTALLDKQVGKGRMTAEAKNNFLAKIKTTTEAKDLKGCDIIVEAVFEDRDLKARVTKEVEAQITETAVFGSNTSSLPITGLAKASARPKNFIGLHFFSPVDKMPLIEIIRGKETSDETLAKSIDYMQLIKKTPIVVNDARGFYTSRTFVTYVAEGISLLMEGVHPATIENAGRAAGMPVGPLALSDEVSLDLLYHIQKQNIADLKGAVPEGHFATHPAFAVVTRFVEEFKRLGKKSKAGFYDYPEGGKKYLWPRLTEVYPIAKVQPDINDLKKRILYIQAIEAIKCLAENVVTNPAEADIGSIFGWGFAPWSGGVCSFVDLVGVKTFVEGCTALQKKYGNRFKAPALLIRMAEEGRGFY